VAVESLGNEVSLELTSGELVELPPSYWISKDQAGDLWARCDVMILPTGSSATGGLVAYDGHLAGRGPTAFRPPPREGWRRAGNVRQVLYTRPDQGGKFHFFEKGQTVHLYSHPGRRAWKLVLPEGCKVNRLGFEWP
jgi:hypothetical protein